ncbi:MAG TPA: hypothetical protein PLJ25_00170, partial [Methanothrix sp.]|nr:hypothetical protein [Methanothrix sp.]
PILHPKADLPLAARAAEALAAMVAPAALAEMPMEESAAAWQPVEHLTAQEQLVAAAMALAST